MAFREFQANGGEDQILNTRRRIQRLQLRKTFLQECLEELVVPKSIRVHFSCDSNPFPLSAFYALRERIESLSFTIEELSQPLQGIQTPHNQVLQLRQEGSVWKELHRRRLQEAIDASGWSRVLRMDLITNISSVTLSPLQCQALSLGFKFDTGLARGDMADRIQDNYRKNATPLERGFVQGVILSAVASQRDQPPSIPRRYIRALRELEKDESIVVVRADKGGGVVILDSADHLAKVHSLLSNGQVYVRTYVGNAKAMSLKFNKAARKVMSRTRRGKFLLWTLEESPRCPTLRVTVKDHKPGYPVRPITDATGAAPHRLSKTLAKFLSQVLGKISGCHLRNSQDMINRISNVPVRCKQLVSFDVTSLYTNVPIADALEAAKIALDLIDEDLLPLPKQDFLQLVELCVRFGPFSFDGTEYIQVEGLAMGSPLAAVLAQLAMEVLERNHLKPLAGPNVIWMRYVDDILAIVPQRLDVSTLLQRLNDVHPTIKFTLEREVSERISFLDVVLHKVNGRLRFSVHRKITNKNDFIHFFSAHSRRVKQSTVVGFFLRAYRICSPEFLEPELQNIMESFRKLEYPTGFILMMKKRADTIHRRAMSRQDEGNVPPTPPASSEPDPIRLVLPTCPLIDQIQHLAGPTVKIAAKSGVKLGDLVKIKRPAHQRPSSQVYSVPCGSCPLQYLGETSRGYSTREAEHRRALRNGDESNAFVVHAARTGHLPAWRNHSIQASGIPRHRRLVIESALIATRANLNTSPGSHDLAWPVAKVISKAIGQVN